MKKKLLSIAAVLAVSSMAFAQTDVTSTYLVNPSFETLLASDGSTAVTTTTDKSANLTDGLYGWEISALKNDAYSNYRVESSSGPSASGFGSPITSSDGDCYYFNRQGWANVDSELKTTTKAALEPGVYYVTIDYKAADFANNNQASSNGTTIGITIKDANDTELGKLSPVTCAYSEVQDGGNCSSTLLADRPWDTMGAMFSVENASVVTFSIQQNMKSNGRSDIVYDNMRLYKYDESSTTMNVSGLIPTANDYLLGGWSIEGVNTFQVNTWSGEGATDGSNMTTPFIQDWVDKSSTLQDAVISQTLTGLVPGKYKATVLVRTLKEGSESITPEGAVMYLNSASVSVCDGTAISGGTYGTYTVEGNVMSDGVLNLGFRITDANFNWLAFKDFQLEYVGALTGEIYELGTMSISHKSGDYFAEDLTQVVVSYPNAANNQDAELSLVASSDITINDQVVTATLNDNKELVIPISNVQAGNTYTIKVPAGVYGYIGHTTNEAVELTYTIVSRLFNETVCYLSTTVNGKNVYVARGSSWGTMGIATNYGIAVTCSATDVDNNSTIKFKDNEKYLFASTSTDTYTDGNAYNWQFAPVEGGYTIKASNNGNGYLAVADNGALTLTSEANYIWKLLSKTEYEAAYASDINQQKQSALTLAGLTEEDLTDAIVTSVYTDKPGFNEAYQIAQVGGDGVAKVVYSHELSGLENGLYRVSMQAFQRTASNASVTSLYKEGYNDVTAYMYAGDARVQLMSVCDDAQTKKLGDNVYEFTGNDGVTYYIPNDVACSEAYFTAGLYKNNELYVYVSDGTLSFGIENASWLGWNGNWTGYGNINVEKVVAQTNVTVAVTDANWGTMILPFAAVIPSGMKVYSCNAFANGYLTLTEEFAIAANTPYIVSGTGSYSFKGVNVAEKDSYTAGYLTGVLTDTEAPEGSYVLQNQTDKGVAFYNVQDVKPTVTANHAYVTLDAANANLRALLLPGSDVTGIETVEAADALVDVYSISGVLVRSGVKKSEALNGLAKGIYVVNGTKQAVK